MKDVCEQGTEEKFGLEREVTRDEESNTRLGITFIIYTVHKILIFSELMG